MCIIIANIPNKSSFKKGYCQQRLMRLALKLPSVANVYMRWGIKSASWFPPAILAICARVCVCVCGGGHISTHNANIEGDQEHQHV